MMRRGHGIDVAKIREYKPSILHCSFTGAIISRKPLKNPTESLARTNLVIFSNKDQVGPDTLEE